MRRIVSTLIFLVAGLAVSGCDSSPGGEPAGTPSEKSDFYFITTNNGGTTWVTNKIEGRDHDPIMISNFDGTYYVVFSDTILTTPDNGATWAPLKSIGGPYKAVS